jgi:thymidylate synthase
VYVEADTLDDLLRLVFQELLKPLPRLKASKEHSFTEKFAWLLRLSNPRARLSRTETKGKVFSALGELLWYLTGENKASFMDYYVPNNFYSKEVENGSDDVRGGYGKRLFDFGGANQVQNVIDLLKRRPTSRRAVFQLFDASDLVQDFRSVPCTCTMQFLIRDDRLDMLVNMRSNDAFLGLPHDVFAFTMLQEIVARSVGVELGEYRHIAGSLHLYENNASAARAYLSEDWQEKVAMPSMPMPDPWSSIQRVQDVERSLREGAAALPDVAELDPYWQDLCRLLYVHRLSKENNFGDIKEVRESMASKSYRVFLDAKVDAIKDALDAARGAGADLPKA